jgi:hypothetical protein
MSAHDRLHRAVEHLDEAIAEFYAAAKEAERFWRPECRVWAQRAMVLAREVVEALAKYPV